MTTRIGDLTADDLAKTLGETYGRDGYLVSSRDVLAGALGRLKRANDGLRQVETGEWQRTFGGRGQMTQLEAWVALLRREVAQALLDVENLLSREG